MRRKPGPHALCLVRTIVGENNVHLPTCGKLPLDGVEKGYEFLLPMTAHRLADYRAVQDVQGRKQRRYAVALSRGRPRRRGLAPPLTLGRAAFTPLALSVTTRSQPACFRASFCKEKSCLGVDTLT